MLEPIATLITSKTIGSIFQLRDVRVWGVFFLCFLFSGIGVGLSFIVFGSTIQGFRLWGVGITLAIIMLGVSYSAKYANKNAREYFTPPDLIQYLSQGFLWPSTWPALADFIGIAKISSPTKSAFFNFIMQMFV